MISDRTPARGRWTRAGAAAALLALAAAGCGRGSEGTGGAASAGGSVATRGDSLVRVAPARHDVVIKAFAFTPVALTVAAGDTVVWVNQDIVPHTATADDGRWGSDTLRTGAAWRRVFDEPGAHPYACQLHPVMKARVEAR